MVSFLTMGIHNDSTFVKRKGKHMMMASEDSYHAQQIREAEPMPSASEVVMTLIATSHRIQRVFNTRLSRQKGAVKLSGPRLRLLMAVEEVGRLRMGDLAEDLGITARTVTTLVDALEREGLLVRLPDSTDRRATLLALTDSARTQFEQVRSLQMELGEELVAPLDLQQRRQLLDLLSRLNQGVLTDEAGDEE
jgi:DNA-binding MarR family transcriptional regulator